MEIDIASAVAADLQPARNTWCKWLEIVIPRGGGARGGGGIGRHISTSTHDSRLDLAGRYCV